ncbi:MAG: DNA recombination protein RmuC [Proteobacteria bacterium]|nr:DNA recombination protein RmuC [Pseudomonadota bacterium]MBU1685767.1 DNA recombination protein RmuC [Pseudomonadota bacterium]
MILRDLRGEYESELAALRATLQGHAARLAEMRVTEDGKGGEVTRLHGEKMALAARIEDLQSRMVEAERRAGAKQEEETRRLGETFKVLSQEVLKENANSFLAMARAGMEGIQERSRSDLVLRQQAINELVKPIQESLQKVDIQIRQIEKERTEANAGLTEQIRLMLGAQNRLQSETAKLASSLRTPKVRGRWGEIQLRRVVEVAGMIEYCDFVQQETADSGSRLRPDMIVKLPGNKNIVVDSKAVILSYLEAQETEDPDRRDHLLKEHALHVRNHMTQLTAKSYWEQFQPSPEFVVMFLPGENFFSAALEQDPQLIEFGVSRKVILSTPTTLIALLRAVSYGWRQENVAEHAQAVGELGKILYERIRTMTDHFDEIRKGLVKTLAAYNRTVGALESRVLVTARKFGEIDPLTDGAIKQLKTVDQIPRLLQEADDASDGEAVRESDL